MKDTLPFKKDSRASPPPTCRVKRNTLHEEAAGPLSRRFRNERKSALKDAIFGDRKSACSQTRVENIPEIPRCAGCLLRTLPFTWQSRKRRPSICATRQSKHELFCEYNRSSALPLDRNQVCNVRERHRCLVQLMRQLSHPC